MENRRVYVCPNCKSWYSHEKNMFSPEADRKESICPNCQHKLVETDIDYEEFSAMAKEEKQRVKQQYLDTHELPVTPHAEAEDENSASGWISGLKIFSWVSFFAIIIAGLVLSIPYFNYSYSQGYVVLIIIAAFLVAFLSVAGMMVFLGMASDLKAIRKNLENMNKKQ